MIQKLLQDIDSPMKKIINLCIIIIIMSYTPQTLYIVPAGPPEQGGVNTGVPPHGPVGQVVDGPELVVQQLRHVIIELRYHGVALLIPVKVLNPEGRKLCFSSTTCKVHVLKVHVPDKPAHIRLNLWYLGTGEHLTTVESHCLES